MAAKKKGSWGGVRAGAGRPKGTGTGPSKDARVNRIVAMLSNDQLKKITRRAKKARLPLGTYAYQIIERSLARG
jgi:hypothetical protein